MAVGIFLNFEKLSIKIIENEIAQMTNDNIGAVFDEISEVDDVKFEHNLYHGSIAATFIVNLYETTLNTILGRRLECTETEIFKTSHDVKLQLICTMFHVDIAEIKGDNSYSFLRSILRLRNDITHFKSNAVAEGHFITTDAKVPMGTSKDALSVQFTKNYMEQHYNGVLNLLVLICKKCGLVIFKDCLVIDCDGRDSACEFVITQQAYDERDRDEYQKTD
jgi:hypothetical protein